MVLNEKYIHNIILDEISNNTAFQPTLMNVMNTFNSINQKCFNDKLPKCSFKELNKRGYLGFFSYEGIANKGGRLINPTIFVNLNYEYDINLFESVVAHEMIHYYLALNGIDMKCNHGNEFNTLANRINSQMGISVSKTVDVSNIGYGTNAPKQADIQILGLMSSYSRSLKKYLPAIKKEMENKNENVSTIIGNLYSFTESLIYALDRCVSKKTLTEGVPGADFSFVDSFINGFKNYRHRTLNFFDNLRYKQARKNGYKGYYTGSNGELMLDKQTRLFDLLYNIYPELKKKFEKIMPLLNSLVLINTFRIIDDLSVKIQQNS